MHYSHNGVWVDGPESFMRTLTHSVTNTARVVFNVSSDVDAMPSMLLKNILSRAPQGLVTRIRLELWEDLHYAGPLDPSWPRKHPAHPAPWNTTPPVTMFMAAEHNGWTLSLSIHAAESMAVRVARAAVPLFGTDMHVLVDFANAPFIHGKTRESVVDFALSAPRACSVTIAGGAGASDVSTRLANETGTAPPIRCLSLKMCDLAEPVWEAVTCAVGSHCMVSISLIRMHLPEQRTRLVVCAIKRSRTLREVVFEECGLDDRLAGMIFAAGAHLKNVFFKFWEPNIGDAAAHAMAHTLLTYAHPCGLAIYHSLLSDEAIAALLNASLTSEKLSSLKVISLPGPLSMAAIKAVAMTNRGLRHFACDHYIVAHKYLDVVPALLHSTALDFNLGRMVHDVGRSYFDVVMHGSRWRNLWSHFGRGRMWPIFGSSETDGLCDIRHIDKDDGASCVVLHAMSRTELIHFIMERLRTAQPFHSLAVGQTDLSGGLPAELKEIPLRRLALMNCSIGDLTGPCRLGSLDTKN